MHVAEAIDSTSVKTLSRFRLTIFSFHGTIQLMKKLTEIAIYRTAIPMQKSEHLIFVSTMTNDACKFSASRYVSAR
jgi:hypothetical protein